MNNSRGIACLFDHTSNTYEWSHNLVNLHYSDDLTAIERHVAFVAVVYSLLRAAQHDTVFQDRLQRELKLPLDGSAASWRRATQAQAL